MSEWGLKRFWSEASVVADGGGHAIRLDGKPVRSPGRSVLAVPSRALAEGIAEEWRAQETAVDPGAMPLTRAANTTLDKVAPQPREVAAHLVEYGGSDLLCYRAEGPADLVARQAEGWDPMLDWAEAAFGVRLSVTRGVMPVAQPAAAMAALGRRAGAFSDWELTALSEFVTLSGSLVLGLAAMEGRAPETLWPLSRIDEDWQAERWGVDVEEASRIAVKRAAFLQAGRYLELLRAPD